MGRPPLDRKAANTVRILIALAKSIRARIKTNLADGERESDFIRKSIESELSSRERKTKEKGKWA